VTTGWSEYILVKAAVIGSLLDMHTTLLIVHVLAAASWLGAGVSVALLSSMAARQAEATGEGLAVSFGKIGNLLFMPAGIIVLITGVVLVLDSPWKFTNLFVIIGIIAVVNGAVFGARVSGPMTKSLQEAHQASDVPKLRALYARFGMLVLVDAGVVVVALIGMILKLGA
jgi:uncharacterized membrane protein